MRSRRLSSASRFQDFSTNLRQLLVRGWRRTLCLVLILGMFLAPDMGYAVSAATDVITKAAKDTVAPVPVAVEWFKRFLRRSAKPARQETTADRSASVYSIRLNPPARVGYQGERLRFSAVGSNANGLTIQGVQFNWSSSDADKLQIDSSGQALLNAPGLVWVSAATANATARVPVLVRPGTRPVQSDAEWLADRGQLRPDGTIMPLPGQPTGSLLDSLVERLAPTAHAQTSGGDSGDFLYDELWSEPRNLVGSPRNRIQTASAIGAVLPEGSNFEFSVPLYTLAGRGVPTGMALNYNSRIWSRHGSAVTFNAVNTWPYLGFTLSFGRIVTYAAGSNTKFILIDSDGTRHYLGSGPGGTTTTYQTNDGSHITYVGNATGGTLYYNSGMTKTIRPYNNRLLVDTVTDPNGNLFAIYYKSIAGNVGCAGVQGYQAIDYIYDTLGRIIQFNYDSSNNLISIDVPGYGGTASVPVTTTIVRFDYTTASPSTSFSGLTVENVPSSCPQPSLSHIYFPATATGYKFTYSAYGMITTVSLRKDMSYNSGSGVISDGNENAYVSFNYPASASSLTDAPSFSQWTQSPAATAGGTATTSFVANASFGSTKSFTVTNPDSSTVTLTRSNTAGTDYGLLTQTEVKTSGGTSKAKSVISYTTDGGGQPQVASIVGYDDATPTANQTKAAFDYDSYGNVTNRREYGYQQSGSWVVRRRSRSVYKTDTSYVNAYLRSLVIEADVYDAQLDTNDGNDVLVAKTTYTYDDYNAMSGMEDYGGTTYNIGRLPGYDATYTLRGNVTGVTQYTDVSAPTTITHLRKLDIFGNVVKEQLSCCNVQSVNTNDTNGYLMPYSLVKGDPSGTTLTTTYDPDFNTSVQKSVTDPNGQQTVIYSRDAALRPTQIDLPTGATQTASYNASTMSVTGSTTYNDGGTSKTVSATTDYDGWGRVIHQTDAFGGQVNTNYDNMGRVASVTNPFTAGGSPSYSTSYSYDALGRVTTTTLQDSQTMTTSYNGNSVTTTDQVNRKMQRVSDGLGRLVTVNEQDSSGNLTQATSYTYDYLNNLTQVDQGSQLRKYKYDAASRLLYEKIPEQTAAINDGTGTYWTGKYTHTDYNAVSTRTDARGVVTSYSYDTLHRLSQVSYNTVSGVTTAPTVTYTYDSDASYSITAQGMLLRVNVGSDYQERYTVDGEFRLASTVRTIGSRSYTTSYSYNEASQLTQSSYPSGLAIAINHDSTGRLSSVQDASTSTNYLSSIGYNTAGQVTGDTLGNGVTEVFGYDAQRMQMTTRKVGTASPYTNRMDLTYSYGATSGQMGVGSTAGNAGQLMSVSGTINGGTESASYTYDNYGRLATSNQTSNGTSVQRRYAYDRWGNRTGVWDATSGGTQIQSITLAGSGGIPTNQISSETHTGSTGQSEGGGSGSITNNYSYDAAGNVTSDGQHSYVYDSENRLVSADSGAATYAYDHQNRRYKKTVGSTVTHYVWEGGQVVAEHNGSTGAVQVNYIYSGSRMLAKIAGGTTSYFLSDRLSVRMTLNTSGSVVGQQGHLPYGGDFAVSGTQQKQHFTSYERDTETGTDYAVNRQYHQGVGRFNRLDPLTGSTSAPQSLNRYSYVGNDPINGTDPTGLYPTPTPGIHPDPRYGCYYIPELQGFMCTYTGAGGSGFVNFIPGGPPSMGPTGPQNPGGGNPGGGSTGPDTRNGRLTRRLQNRVARFLEGHPDCADAINSRLQENGSLHPPIDFNNIRESGINFEDTTGSDLSRTVGALGFPARYDPNVTLGDIFTPIPRPGGGYQYTVAVTNPLTKTVYFAPNALAGTLPVPEAEMDRTVVHEMLHALFGTHVEVANALGLTNNGAPFTSADNDLAASAMNTWLDSGCPAN